MKLVSCVFILEFHVLPAHKLELQIKEKGHTLTLVVRVAEEEAIHLRNVHFDELASLI